MKNNRDFIDFLIELINQKKIFLVILILFLTLATYFNVAKNDSYSFNTSMKITSESVLVQIMNNINVYNTPVESYLAPVNASKTSLTYESFAEDLCELIKSTFVDENFLYKLTDDFINKNPSELNRRSVFDVFSNAIEKKTSDASVCVNVKLSAPKIYIDYLKESYEGLVTKYLQDEMGSRIQKMRSGKIEYLEKTLGSTQESRVQQERGNVLERLELNSIEERNLGIQSMLALVKNTEIVNTDLNYVIWKNSNIGKNLNYIFLYAFAVFMSIIFFVFTVVLIEFKNQYKYRESQNT